MSEIGVGIPQAYKRVLKKKTIRATVLQLGVELYRFSTYYMDLKTQIGFEVTRGRG